MAALPAGPVLLLFRRPDLRLHRKIVVIDGRVGYTGSMNLAAPRFFKQKRNGLPPPSTWGETMDHKEQHHQHHEKEREHEKKKAAEHERELERKGIHPGWFVGLGAVLILIAILIYTIVSARF